MAELASALDEKDDLEGKLNSLRRYRAEEFIRIGLHDIGGELELENVIAQLSDLAEACLDGALKISFQELEKSYGQMTGGSFAILGMGKLGGREIDYNSDLDLMPPRGPRVRAPHRGASIPMNITSGSGRNSSLSFQPLWQRESFTR